MLFGQNDSMKSVLFWSFDFINLCSDLVYGLVLMTRQIVYLCDESIKTLLIFQTKIHLLLYIWIINRLPIGINTWGLPFLNFCHISEGFLTQKKFTLTGRFIVFAIGRLERLLNFKPSILLFQVSVNSVSRAMLDPDID